MKTRARTCASALAALALGACSLKPPPRAPVAYHDLGPAASPAAGPAIDALIVVHDPTGPLWLDSGNMHYRLAYDDPSRVRRFANSQWVASPLQMIGERLRAALAARAARGGALPDVGVPGDYWVRASVEEFCQIFDERSRSRGVLKLRVALVKTRGHALVEQRLFVAEVPAPSADAHGGVLALAQALDQASTAVAAWVAEAVGRPAPEGGSR